MRDLSRISLLALLVCAIGFFAAPDLHAQQATVTGTVTSADTGEPLIGANVLIEGTTYGAATDTDGSFTVNVPSGAVRGQDVTVIARFVGYRTARQPLTLTEGDHVFNFELRSDALRFDDVIVTGQVRETRRREIGSQVSSISSDDIDMAPVTSMSQLLQGRLPGVSVQQSGGNVGQASRIVTRGPVSLATGVQPVIYVDGVRIDNSRATGTWTGGIAWGGLDDINWNDVERVEVVRGSSAATLYGTQAASGVIQIFTKSGMSPRPTEWTYSSQVGFRNTPASYYEEVSVWGEWFHENYTRQGLYQQQQLSAQGNIGGYQYYTSFTYRTADGTLPDNREEYYSMRGNLQFLPREDLVVRLNTGLSQRMIDAPQEGNNIYSYLINGIVGGPDGFQMPVDQIPFYDVSWLSRRVNATLTGDYTPRENLTLRFIGGIEHTGSDNQELVPFGLLDANPAGAKTVYQRTTLSQSLEASGTFNTALTPDITSTTTAGVQWIRSDNAAVQSWGDDFPAPGVETLSALIVTNSWESRLVAKELGYFAQQRFGFYDLFFLSAGMRIDEHSAFGVDFGAQVYPSFDMSYVISEHGFLPGFINEMRLRFAYGQSGQSPSTFAAMRLWSPISALDGQAAATTSNLGDVELGPERSEEIEVGLDFAVLGGRVDVEATYYMQETKDAIFPVVYPPSSGWLATQQHNVAGVENSGVEIALNARVFESRNFSWNLGYNFSYNENEVTKIDAEVGDVIVQWEQRNREGYPVASYFGERFVLSQDADGEYQAELVDGFIGPSFPVRTMQISSDFSFLRDFNLRVLFDHAGGHYTQNFGIFFINALGADPRVHKWENDEIIMREADEILEISPWHYYYWGFGGGEFQFLDAQTVFRADYWRLRELTLSYNVPSRFAQAVGMRNAQVYFTGRNLWRWLKSEGFIMDAELNYQQASGTVGEYATQEFFIQPNPQQFIFGLRVGF